MSKAAETVRSDFTWINTSNCNWSYWETIDLHVLSAVHVATTARC